MGKKAKEHRRKVQKRNQRIAQEKDMMKKQIDKLFEQRLENVNIEAKLGDQNLPNSIINDSGIFPNTKLNAELGNLDFTDSNNDEIVDIEVINNDPEYDSAGFSIEDREEPQVDDQISELEK